MHPKASVQLWASEALDTKTGPIGFQQLLSVLHKDAVSEASQFLDVRQGDQVFDLYCGSGTTLQLWTRAEPEAWRRRLFFQMWKGATLVLVLPYLCFWERRFRRALARRAAVRATPIPSLAHG